jgi:hypothetical protein
MTLKLSNYNKPSNPKWALVGNICLYAIPLYIPILLSLPLTDNGKLWVNAISSMVLATVKIISKFTSDSNYVEPTSDITEDIKQ